MTRLCDLSNDGNTVTSVSWSERGHQLAVGTHHGYVTIWDVQASKQVNTNVWLFSMKQKVTEKCRNSSSSSTKQTNKENVMQIDFGFNFHEADKNFAQLETLQTNFFLSSFVVVVVAVLQQCVNAKCVNDVLRIQSLSLMTQFLSCR